MNGYSERKFEVVLLRVVVALFVSVILIAAASSCGRAHVISYRLTVRALSDGVIHTGSTVITTYWKKEHGIGPAVNGSLSWAFWFRGDAVVVDLGKHGLLFVTLSRDGLRSGQSLSPAILLLDTFHFDNFGDLSTASFARMGYYRGAPKAVKLESLPLIVRFRDLNDPRSAERLEPRNFEASYGQGTRLLDATISITDQHYSTGILHLAPWMRRLSGSIDHGKTRPYDDVLNMLHDDSFEQATDQ